MTARRSGQASGLLAAIALAVAGCGSAPSGPGAASATGSTGAPRGGSAARSGSLPPGVMPATRACRQVIDGRWSRRFFTGIEQVHLALTTYAKGEPVESRGDISHGMPPRTPVWIVEVHAKAINAPESAPAVLPGSAGSRPAPPTDYSVVMNARTGLVTDSGSCNCWPLPLSELGTVASLPPQC